MKKSVVLFVTVISFILFTAIPSQGQEWSKDQKEVWSCVENTWAGWAEGNVDKVMAGVHQLYVGWNSDDPLPSDRARMEKMFRKMMPQVKALDYDLVPARVTVVDNAAVAHYYYSFTFTMGEDKKPMNHKGKFTEFYIRKGNTWSLLGDFTSFDDEDED